jgi:VWFA-related protein
MATQRRMMALTVDYLSKALRLLPDLSATRFTTSFETRPSQSDSDPTAENPLRVSSKSAPTVFYRDGHEFLDAGARKSSAPRTPEKGLTTWGEFGSILGAVVIDAARNHLVWSHWELSAAGPQAVFRYAVPVERSHYDVRLCCVPHNYGMEMNVVTERVGYRGEITIDPDSGTILRITVVADLPATSPISMASIAVEYGSEEIGGKTYVCPVRGIALARSPDLTLLNNPAANPAFLHAASTQASSTHASGTAGKPAALEQASLTSSVQGPRQTLLNDVVFRQFHLFRSESKVVAPNQVEAESSQPGSIVPAAATTGAETRSDDSAKPADEMAAAAAAAPAASAVPAANSASMAEPAPGGAAPAEVALPEVAVSTAYGLPDSPQASGGDASTSFRINARLVDVALVALDKKGHPVTNLKPEDIEIFDNKAKVELGSFSLAGSAVPDKAANAAQPAAPAGAKPQFSNRAAESKSGNGDAQLNTIILLLDDTLSFADLTNARRHMEEFLGGLHGNERVAVYVMQPGGGVKTVQETTTDHLTIAAVLSKWLPSAQNLSLGQEQEARNRQTMDYVRNVDDLLSVNGNNVTDAQSHVQAPDPNLQELGDNPGRDALSGLVVLARRLATIPGHKSLVWIASDNTLADWNNSGLNIEKGAHYIEPAALRAQEAMNDAHVSVYPVDVSQLEAGMIDASIADRNVQLIPTNSLKQVAGCGNVSNPGTTAGAFNNQLNGTGDPALTSGADITTCNNDARDGRMKAQIQQDAHSIQGVYREIADATGGRAFARASDITRELNGIADEGRATYLLSFTPPEAADGKYHLISIKPVNRNNLTFRYRTGYFYRQQASTMKDRFRDAAFQPEDANDIGVTADLVSQLDQSVAADAAGRTIKLNIAATDLALGQKDAFWTDKVDVFVVQRKSSATAATVTGQTMALRLKPASYQKYLREGLPFNQVVEVGEGVGAVRVVIVDENSGRMGSLTLPASAFGKQN